MQKCADEQERMREGKRKNINRRGKEKLRQKKRMNGLFKKRND